jgi:tRNA A-37 threonylcarbamoyl transferase component Bud32
MLSDRAVERSKASAKGGSRKRCKIGKSCSATCISHSKVCLVEIPWVAASNIGKIRNGLKKEPGYDSWTSMAKGNYGEVKFNPDETRAVKLLLSDKEGKAGEFGPYELGLARKMGELGHSPKIHSSSDKHIEMDVAKGKPLWSDYSPKEGEPNMNAAQARKAAGAIEAIHKMGFFHGDMHALQFLVDGDNVKLVDYGLSGPVSSNPARVMQDLSKIAKLVNWKNPELENDPYVKLVNKHLDAYKNVSGFSKAAKNKRVAIGQQYLKELESLK